MSGFGGGSLSSPLTLALLGGSTPGLLPAMQHMSLAQAMLQQGTSDAPARPLQGLARIAQALYGVYGLRNADNEIQKLVGQGDNGMSQIQQIEGMGAQPASPTAAAPAAPAPQASAVPAAIPRNQTQTAGMQANNPGNLMYAGQPDASGTIALPGGRSLAAFPDVPTGVAANARQLMLNADQHGVQSVRQMVTRWVGDPKADLTSYIADTSKAIGADPDAPVNWHDPKVQTAFLQAQYPHESAGGSTSLQPADVEAGVKLANTPHGTQYAQAGNVMTDAVPGAPAAQPAAPAGPQVGMDNPQVRRQMEQIYAYSLLAAQHPLPYDPVGNAARAMLEYHKQQMGVGNIVQLPDGTQLNLNTGQHESAAAPQSHFVQTPTGFIDTTGLKPGTFAPSPRVFQTPAGDVGAVGPGGTITPITGPNNPGVAARHAAEAQGSATGTGAVKTADKMFDLGREADTALGNIDYGINQLHQAAQGGINSGYFAPWLATAAAAGKSLGVNLNALGIDPKAVGNVQSAQKTLGVVAGSILQNTIGKDSQITDAKIEHFIHTQPGIETDPQAIDRILNWARSQFVYNRNMAMDAMKNTNPDTGMLPPGWRASYVARNGAFAPIYDPLGGEMKQPAGEGPPAEAPKPQASAPAAHAAPAQPSRADIEAEMRRRGLIK